MRVIYIGYAVPRNPLNDTEAVSPPANAMALGIIEGLKDRFGTNLEVICIPVVPCYPKSKTKLLRKQKIQLFDGVIGYFVGFVNIPVVKYISLFFSLSYKLVSSIINNKSRNGVNLIITVNSNAVISMPLFISKAFAKTVKICYMSDLPEDLRKKLGLFSRMLIKLDNHIRRNALRMYDASIVFVEEAAKHFMPGRPYLVIDHIFDEVSYGMIEDRSELKGNRSQEIVIMYTGSLDENYRIPEMLDAVDLLPSNYVLEVYGRGSYADFVNRRSTENPRIKYKGFLAPESVPATQSGADILVSFLNTEQPIGRFAIPSKIVGYLASGRPIISSKAESIPLKYREFLNFVDEESPKSIAEKIIEISARYEFFLCKAIAGRDFLMQHCNWSKQVGKIADFIDSFDKKDAW